VAFCSACGAPLQTGIRRAVVADEREERRVVSVLFADLAGSTALGERLDPEDVRALQSELFGLVNEQVVRYGGITEKFIGDAILAVFGVPQAHEDDAERAVRAALGIRDAFPAFAARVAEAHDAEVGLRIGVNTGDVISSREAAARGELIVTGDAVNVAARLQQLAEPGEVLVGERTRQATHRVISYRDQSELVAKGKALPLKAWQAVAATAPLGTRGSGLVAPLIGRDDEIALLRLAAARVERERSPQLVTVFGQAGVGKSRLVSEFVDVLDAAHVLVGRCVPYGDGITYLPLAEVAGALAGIRDDEPADVALEKLRSSVAGTVPAEHVEQIVAALAWTMGLSLPGRTAGIGLGGEVRHRLHDAWTKYLAALGRGGLVVLVVEDIHWASEPLLDLLADVIDNLEDTGVLVICPSRPELLDARPSWGTGRLNASSLTLGPLSSGDAARLLQALLDFETIPDAVAEQILGLAEGNPFFVEELLAMLVEQGAIEERNGSWVPTERLAITTMPDSIHGVIAARLDLLEAREREALRQCSVMGRVFWPSAVGVDDDLVATLGRRAIVSEQPESAFSGRREFAFKHALTHEVAYATLPRYERGALHRRVAEWIGYSVPDRQAETTELIAFHFEQALHWGDHDAELRQRAFDALQSAGDAAIRRGAYTSAERLLGRALELAPTDDARAEALLMAARVDIHSSQYDRAMGRLAEVIAIADTSGDAAIRADALGLRARASWLLGRWRDALESAEAAVATLEGLPESEELARALARLSQIQMLRALSTAEATSTRAIEVAVRTGESAAEANARNNLFTARSSRGIVPSVDDVSKVIEIALAAGAHDEAVRGVVNYLWSAALLGPLDPVERLVTELAATHLERGLTAEAYDEYLQLSLAGLIYLPSGRWLEADAAVARESHVATNRLVWLWVVSGLALRRGDLALADRYLPELRETALASEEPQRILPMVSVAMPRALLADDLETVSHFGDLVVGLPMHAISYSPSTLAIPRTLALTGDAGRLEALLGTFSGVIEGAPAVLEAVTRGLLVSLTGEPQEAAHILAAAEADLRTLDRYYDAACVALDGAAALDASGDVSGAESARARAAALLETLACVNPF
jgi:class 3 adenylate cyclase/tetratricopeptide (TPR) repeat protein